MHNFLKITIKFGNFFFGGGMFSASVSSMQIKQNTIKSDLKT